MSCSFVNHFLLDLDVFCKQKLKITLRMKLLNNDSNSENLIELMVVKTWIFYLFAVINKL